MTLYTLEDIQAISELSTYALPDKIKTILQNLESIIGVPKEDMPTSFLHSNIKHVNYRRQRHNHLKSGEVDGNTMKQFRHSTNSFETEEDWNAVKSFKPTKSTTPKSWTENIFQELRASLNKLSLKTYDLQVNLIIKNIQLIASQDTNYESSNEDGDAQQQQHVQTNVEENLNKVIILLFDVISLNKIYHELYAKLYHEIIKALAKISYSTFFIKKIQDAIFTFKQSFEEIQYKDPNVNYDEYCKYIKTNEKRRAFACFLVSCANIRERSEGDSSRAEGQSPDACRLLAEEQSSGVKVTDLTHPSFHHDIIDLIKYIQEYFINTLSIVNKTNECEEMSEVITIMVSLACKNTQISEHSDWKENIIKNIHKVSILNVKECQDIYPSISSRTIFAHLPLRN